MKTRTTVLLIGGAFFVVMVESDQIEQGKTIKVGNVIIVGTKERKEN